SQAIGAFIKSALPAAVAAAVNSISDLLDRGALAARDQPRHSAQVADADQGAIEVVVFGHAGGAGAVVHRHAHRLPARALHQRRQVAVHVVEVGQVEEGGAFEQLDAAAGVGRVVVQHAHADRIGPLRRPALAAGVLAVDAPAGDHFHVAAALGALGDQLGDVGRDVLAIAVERGDPFAARGPHPGTDRRALAALADVV